ncbi:hypothetical protein B0A50_07590 [Salinomyces thailandicus]|uniref:Uncharacterized protein n=1 Tax=Salinomyces thailandicus TaxID=706561 RepID=A0A4U0TMT1_9PEZI|nr:hypothetical protein B0A50_07590 [Salinomyces thailandica]
MFRYLHTKVGGLGRRGSRNGRRKDSRGGSGSRSGSENGGGGGGGGVIDEKVKGRRSSIELKKEDEAAVESERVEGGISRTTVELPSDGSAAECRSVDQSDQSPSRIRFSLDRPEREVEKENSATHQSSEMLPDSACSQEKKEEETPVLSIDSRAADIMNGGPVSGPPIIGSPSNVEPSATASSSYRASAPPMSPRSMSRGMSLRSSLFTRNMDRKVRSSDNLITMQATRPMMARQTSCGVGTGKLENSPTPSQP